LIFAHLGVVDRFSLKVAGSWAIIDALRSVSSPKRPPTLAEYACAFRDADLGEFVWRSNPKLWSPNPGDLRVAAQRGHGGLLLAIIGLSQSWTTPHLPGRKWVMADSLNWAAEAGQLWTAKLILDHDLGSQVLCYLISALYTAASRRRRAMVRFLLERGLRMAYRTTATTDTANERKACQEALVIALSIGLGEELCGRIIRAAQSDDDLDVKSLLGLWDGQITVDLVDTLRFFKTWVFSRVTPMEKAACEAACIPVLRLLLDRNPSQIEALSPGGETLLQTAVMKGSAKTVHFLLERGARFDADTLVRATRRGEFDILALFLEYGGDVHHISYDRGLTLPMESLLLQPESWTPVLRCTTLLLDKDANPNARAQGGKTFLHLAADRWAGASEYSWKALLSPLVSRGMNPNDVDDQGQTPLHIAAEKGGVSAVRSLLACGADPTIKDKSGRTAGDLAHGANKPETEKVLRAAELEIEQLPIVELPASTE
jgi:ankyrin repeat protein